MTEGDDFSRKTAHGGIADGESAINCVRTTAPRELIDFGVGVNTCKSGAASIHR